MFLPNQRLTVLLTVGFVMMCLSCGPSAVEENKPVGLTDKLKSDFPFATKEPEVYQGDFVLTAGESEQHWFIARKGDKWRFDVFRDGVILQSRLKTDRLYSVGHPNKIYAAEPVNDISTFGSLSYGFFMGKEYREFEDLGRDGDLLKYRVRSDDPVQGETIIYIDEPTGMMLRQEFLGPDNLRVTYEIKDLKVEVDDSVFAIPEGYRKVAWAEFQKLVSNQKR